MKFDFNDILIEPCAISKVQSRKQVKVLDDNGFLPLFTAPMDTVVEKENLEIFIKNKIYPIIPRTSFSTNVDMDWLALSLKEFEEKFLMKELVPGEPIPYRNILIDIANGHMLLLLDAVKKAKKKYGNLLNLMVGNVANPSTYQILSEAGADYIRIGIGNGSGCSTSVHTGIGYPLASLISECRKLKALNKLKSFIVADGGIRNYADIIKSLALGADYVMCGGIFNKALESAGHTFAANKKIAGITIPGERVNQYDTDTKLAFKAGAVFYKKFRGMSTKEVQKHLSIEPRAAEGVTRMVEVEYTLDGWVENFKDYLASAMSYCGAFSLSEFIGKPTFNIISQNSFERFNK